MLKLKLCFVLICHGSVDGGEKILFVFGWNLSSYNTLVLSALPSCQFISSSSNQELLKVKIKVTGEGTFRNALLHLPNWHRTRDWGLKKNVSLETVRPHNDYPWNDEEEKIAWNNFFYGTTNGIILELGAVDGKKFSVSQFFETEVGWRSILVEGNPLQAVKIPKNRPNAISFKAVICEKPRIVNFATRVGVGGIVEFMDPGFLTEFHSYLLTNGKLDEEKLATVENVIKVPCIPLSHILLPLKIFHINFFMLDVEGGELNVLKAIDFEKIKFDVIAVETDRGTDSEADTKNYVYSVVQFMISKGYDLWSRKLGRNSWFKHPDFVGFSKNRTSRRHKATSVGFV